MKIVINKKKFFDNKLPPVIIAEISCNHNGSKKNFLDHIKLAKQNGADMIKIQTYRPKDMVINKNYRIKSGEWKNINLWKLYEKACTPFDWHHSAFKLAKKINIPLFSSPFSIEAVNFLEKNFNPPLYKIASFEITDVKLIKEIAKLNKLILISTGMANLNEIKQAISLIKRYHSKIIIMHCVSGYPTPEEAANISFINKLREKFKGIPLGLSDHTNDIYSSLASVPLGVVAIEKHFIKSNSQKSLDSKFSLNPKKLFELKTMSKKIYISLGSENKNTKIEKNSKLLRRSIFTTKYIKKNTKISINNINTFRPSTGICASKYFKVVGKYSKRTTYRSRSRDKTNLE